MRRKSYVKGSVLNISYIRNFSIIAHIDHGKSTLADRFIELTGAVEKREMKEQILDSMELERERGITIKSQTVLMSYRHKNKTYYLNMIDTPGHVDFSYEVSRAMRASEGVLLLVDATQGVQAQTIANAYMAIEAGCKIIPVINKIDLKSADVTKCKNQITSMIGIDASSAVEISAKTGEGVVGLLERVVELVPAPIGNKQAPLRALVVDSWYDNYKGVVMLVRVMDGNIKSEDKLFLMGTMTELTATEIGVFKPKPSPVYELSAGMVGYVASGIKDISRARVGDTLTELNRKAEKITGYQQAKQIVFAGIYPENPENYDKLKEAIEKLKLNDASISYEPETSGSLGFGFRCGFLGMLHLDIFRERIEREYNLPIVVTSPTVAYHIYYTDGSQRYAINPNDFDNKSRISCIKEPIVKVSILVPSAFIGNIMKLLEERRGVQKQIEYITEKQTKLVYVAPLSEIITDFYDKLKSASKGMASFDYEEYEEKQSDLVKVDLLVNGRKTDSLSFVSVRSKAYRRAREMLIKLRELIPRQLFEVSLQAAIGGKIIAKERIAPLRKNVTSKCYGGDITRKRKLLEKQKEGKKRMKKLGKVLIPTEAFVTLLRR